MRFCAFLGMSFRVPKCERKKVCACVCVCVCVFCVVVVTAPGVCGIGQETGMSLMSVLISIQFCLLHSRLVYLLAFSKRC